MAEPRRFDLVDPKDELVSLSTAEAAQLLGCSEKTIRRWIKDSSLRAFNIAREGSRPAYRILRSEIFNFIQLNTKSPHC